MAKAKKTRIKTTAIPAPATQQEAEQLLADIGKLQRQVNSTEQQMNDKLAAIKASYEQRAQPLNDSIEEMFHALQVWAEANKGELLKGKAKTAKLATGEIKWRMTPKKVNLSKVDDVIERLKKLKLTKFIRNKPEVNKEAILADEAAVSGVKGISISQKEEFVAVPFETNIERAEVVKSAA